MPRVQRVSTLEYYFVLLGMNYILSKLVNIFYCIKKYKTSMLLANAIKVEAMLLSIL